MLSPHLAARQIENFADAPDHGGIQGDRTTLILAFNFFLGSGESEYGSLPQLWNVRAGIQYFF